MKRLLQIEYIKLWNSRSSRFLIIAYFVLLTSIALIAAIKFDIGPIEFHLADQGIFNFPYIWHFNTFVAAVFKLFLAIVIVSMMSNEYTNKTIKQNLIDGLSKKEFIASKFLTVIAHGVLCKSRGFFQFLPFSGNPGQALGLCTRIPDYLGHSRTGHIRVAGLETCILGNG